MQNPGNASCLTCRISRGRICTLAPVRADAVKAISVPSTRAYQVIVKCQSANLTEHPDRSISYEIRNDGERLTESDWRQAPDRLLSLWRKEVALRLFYW